MNGMEKIKAKIEESARAELTAIEKESSDKVAEIKAQAEAEASRVAEEIVNRGKEDAGEHGKRLQSSAQMECRKVELAMKQEVISEAFDKALEELCGCAQGDYVNLCAALALSSLTSGNEVLIFNSSDKDKVGKQVVDKVNAAISAGKHTEFPGNVAADKASSFLKKVLDRVGKTANVQLSNETRSVKAGFIMLDGDVEVNCDFDTLVRLQRNELELEVSNILF